MEEQKNKIPCADQHACSGCTLGERLFVTTTSCQAIDLLEAMGEVMSLTGSPSTLWRLRPAIYGAAQNYIASETST